MAASITIPPSESGFYKPELSAAHEHQHFLYKPGTDLVVNLPILEALIAAEVVTNVVAAD